MRNRGGRKNQRKYATDAGAQKGGGCELIPSQMRKFRAREAVKLRGHLAIMLGAHICFLALELFLYPFMLLVLA